MGALGGPSPIGANGQVTVPKHILRQLGLSAGDMVMFRIADDDPEQLSVVPVHVAERRYARGEHAERLMRITETGPKGAGTGPGAAGEEGRAESESR